MLGSKKKPKKPKTEEADASPAKEFFIRMITRDIDLDDCILDLVDNSIDGARRLRNSAPGAEIKPKEFKNLFIKLGLAQDEFSIEDNCGGIPVADARDYAFHFGRHADDRRDTSESIGIYGIGMKRAMFKIGREIEIRSATASDSFEVDIDVDKWERLPAWKFEITTGPGKSQVGTTITIKKPTPPVAADLADVAFANDLEKTIARDYTVFLEAGLKISIDEKPVTPVPFTLRSGDEFEPARLTYEDGGVTVQLTAGIAAPLPDPDDELAQSQIKDVSRYGWFVLCNNRVVLAGDKSSRTVWGNDGFTRWHPQYNGFLGIASFRSADPAKLPWTTTKRDVDDTDPVYRRAIQRMKDLTSPFIEYTRERKADPDAARRVEAVAKSVPVASIPMRATMKLPKLTAAREKMRNVLYRRPERELLAAAEALGNPSMTYRDIGNKTFEYFYEREVEE